MTERQTQPLESGRQVELKHPALAGSLERSREIELSDRKTPHVDAERDAGRGDAFPRAAEKGRRFAPVPRDPAVGEKD